MLSAAAALYGALTDIREIYFSEAAQSVCVQKKNQTALVACVATAAAAVAAAVVMMMMNCMCVSWRQRTRPKYPHVVWCCSSLCIRSDALVNNENIIY